MTYILPVSSVSILDLIVWLNIKGQDDITFIGRQSMRFEIQTIGMAYPTLAHA